MVVAGFASYWYTDWGQAIGGLLIIASAIAIGLLMMAPYPVMLFFAWARNQDQQNNNKK
ncbi:hypothetical protein GCM10007895_25750 [Paraferrimonas sedimenticola]|uniref:Uncharacterized protein n=2 Tax=Paraferrimonas sedimenticola TaxID=375674 RepID=A0AA37RY50_9GAMM|nr:hypothetical protein GCM10007895_25750 [Paraferrimonas sedimenticola]